MTKISWGERVFDGINVLVMLILIVITLYPMLYIIFSSLSEGNRLLSHTGLLLWPQGFSLEG